MSRTECRMCIKLLTLELLKSLPPIPLTRAHSLTPSNVLCSLPLHAATFVSRGFLSATVLEIGLRR